MLRFIFGTSVAIVSSIIQHNYTSSELSESLILQAIIFTTMSFVIGVIIALIGVRSIIKNDEFIDIMITWKYLWKLFVSLTSAKKPYSEPTLQPVQSSPNLQPWKNS